MTAQSPKSTTMQRSIGEGRLSVKTFDNKARIDDLYQKANAKIRVPKSTDATLEAVLINTSGGLTGDDQLRWQIDARDQAHTIITTQACEKIYKSTDGTALVETKIEALDNSTIEWLPQEAILFDESNLNRKLDVKLSASATFIGLEAVVLGRVAMGEPARKIQLRDQWRIAREGQPIHAENIALSGDIETHLDGAAILNGGATFASLVCCYAQGGVHLISDHASKMREAAASSDSFSKERFGLSEFPEKIVARFVADDMYDLRKTLIPVLAAARSKRELPKVWSL